MEQIISKERIPAVLTDDPLFQVIQGTPAEQHFFQSLT